jgi:ATP-dependent RNA helicase DeaD
VMEIATAAVKLLHAASGEEEEGPEIPAIAPPPERPAKGREREKRPPKRRAAPPGEMAKVFVGAGRRAGMRPADLVGAIANEAGVEARRIGAIEIADAFSVVEVPADQAEQVIHALRATTLRGRKVTVKRNRG